MKKEILWELFKNTGKIEYYMAWKKEDIYQSILNMRNL